MYVESSVAGPATAAEARINLRDAVTAARRFGIPPQEIHAMVATHAAPPNFHHQAPRPDAPDRTCIYTELPEGLIPLGDTFRKYGCPMASMHDWIAQGRLQEMGRLKAPARGGGYTLVRDSELQECLKVRRKRGRPRKAA